MKNTGIIRPVDKMGRVVIPKELRNLLSIESECDSLEIFLEGDKIVLQKYQPTCILCNNFAKSVEMNGHSVCFDCIDKLRALKEQASEL